MGLSHERTRIFTDFCLSHRHPHTDSADTGHSKVQRGTAYTQESRRTCQHDGLESGLSKTRLLLSRDQGNEGEVSAQHSKATPTAANAWKMRQMAHLNAVGSTSCLILSPEGRAPRCCQCNSDRDCNDTCDASKSTTDGDSGAGRIFAAHGMAVGGRMQSSAGGGQGASALAAIGASRAAGLQSPNSERSHRRRPLRRATSSPSIEELVRWGRVVCPSAKISCFSKGDPSGCCMSGKNSPRSFDCRTVIGPTRTNYPTNRPVCEFLVFF